MTIIPSVDVTNIRFSNHAYVICWNVVSIKHGLQTKYPNRNFNELAHVFLIVYV